MCEFKDFRRNILCFKEHDENSFIGKWYDDGVWDDEEYWKLENDLIEVRKNILIRWTYQDMLSLESVPLLIS